MTCQHVLPCGCHQESILDQPVLNDLSSMLCVAFMTLELMPRNPAKIRWTVNKPDDNDLSTPSTDRVLLENWRGFVQLIVTAYYERRMSWYSIPKLQLEQQVCKVHQRFLGCVYVCAELY